MLIFMVYNVGVGCKTQILKRAKKMNIQGKIHTEYIFTDSMRVLAKNS